MLGCQGNWGGKGGAVHGRSKNHKSGQTHLSDSANDVMRDSRGGQRGENKGATRTQQPVVEN